MLNYVNYKIRPCCSKKLNQSGATLSEFETLEGFKGFQLFTTIRSKITMFLRILKFFHTRKSGFYSYRIDPGLNPSKPSKTWKGFERCFYF